MSGYWATPDPYIILGLGLAWIGLPIGMVVVTTLSDRKHARCVFLTNGGMHCSGKRRHDGPHTFTNREWRRTRHSAAVGVETDTPT